MLSGNLMEDFEGKEGERWYEPQDLQQGERGRGRGGTPAPGSACSRLANFQSGLCSGEGPPPVHGVDVRAKWGRTPAWGTGRTCPFHR